ncbi:hypothetical protein AVEN_37446-1 [Araneus ventricosus]|uniref:Uncharacterized protein n=1 Tax=Araneus ventricosus TaxID=182803 RepID=A0A4Y2FCC2_ARAVE|nr:hypothetical protein AVEN_37446-1 [Araneus ventricosus]
MKDKVNEMDYEIEWILSPKCAPEKVDHLKNRVQKIYIMIAPAMDRASAPVEVWKIQDFHCEKPPAADLILKQLPVNQERSTAEITKSEEELILYIFSNFPCYGPKDTTIKI